jgi:hypothetical protein
MADLRDITSGYEIPSENYVDQPYVVITRDGNWLCVLTTGPGQESQTGQHVVATISKDHGQTWSPLIDIESSEAPRSSWVTAAVMPNGRVYAFYLYDHDGIVCPAGGRFAFRYSDDNGLTWSQRYPIPMRITRQDRENVTGGKTKFFWCIDKPKVVNGDIFLGIPKMHDGYQFDQDEGWVIRGDGIATAEDPNDVVWHTLPEGDEGVFNPELGPVQEEQNIEVLSDGSLYMCNRTVCGNPAYAVSRDHGLTWSTPQIMRYADGRPIKTPRACPRIWKAGNGKYIFWYHNNGYSGFPGWGNAGNRQPVWISGGIEVDGEIQWSQPEIILYSPDPTILGCSYPDFVEQDGRYWVTETEKMVGRVHPVDARLYEAVWNQHLVKDVAQQGIVFASAVPLVAGQGVDIPRLPSLDGGGFTLDMWLEVDDPAPGQVVLSSLGQREKGFRVLTAADGALKLELTDGQLRWWVDVVDGPDLSAGIRMMRPWNWDTDREVIRPGSLHHVVFIVDGAAKVVSVLVDGVLCDGKAERIQGWWRLNPYMLDLNEDQMRLRVGDSFKGRIHQLRLYDRYLLTTEAIGNYRAGCPGVP